MFTKRWLALIKPKIVPRRFVVERDENGTYLQFGYGSDEDTLPMIYVFESKLNTGTFVSSRFTGNPVAEIGIGFLAKSIPLWTFG